MNRARAIPIVVIVAAACSSDPSTPSTHPDASPAEETVTYYRNVKPILDAKCGGCHVAGGIGPFPLQTHEDAALVAGELQVAVVTRHMPPWPPDDDCAEYVGRRSLTDAQIETIDTWVDHGAPAGDPADEGAPLEDDRPRLSRVDLRLEMPEEYTAQLEPDDYRCFLIEWPHTTTRYVTGFGADPGSDPTVHHVIAFLASPDQASTYEQLDAEEAGPGYTCVGGTGGPANRWLGGWAPGGLGSDLPPGTGLAVEPGSLVILQVHYNSDAHPPQPDRTAIQLKIDDAVDRVATVQPWTNPSWVLGGTMQIPAGDDDVMHEWSFDPTVVNDGAPLSVYSAALHMHQLGTRAELVIERGDGSSDCLLRIPAWDFHWQGSYGLAATRTIEPGDRLRLQCHWNNATGTQDVSWGEGTSDEMCLGIFLWTSP